MFCAAFAGGRAPWLAARRGRGCLGGEGRGAYDSLAYWREGIWKPAGSSSCWALRGPWTWRGRADRVLNTVKQRIPAQRLRALDACEIHQPTHTVLGCTYVYMPLLGGGARRGSTVACRTWSISEKGGAVRQPSTRKARLEFAPVEEDESSASD